MKYIKQILIIVVISFIGEILNYIIPLPIPGSIYGMVLLFVLLCSGILKIHQIQETGEFLIDIMPILFIPSAVGIITQFEQLKSIWVEIIAITIVTTFITMGVTGLTTQAVMHIKKQRKEKK